MKTRYTVALSMFAGFVLGVTIHGLHAQGRTPVYTVSEIQITDPDAYVKEYAPLAQASVRAHGGKLLAAGSVTSLEEAPPSRITIQVWDSIESVQAWHRGTEFKKAREVGDKYAKFRTIAVVGVPQ